MFALKKNYYLIIQSIKDIDLSNIKKRYKFTIIYRNNSKIEKITDLINFRRFCKKKGINFFVANNFKLAIKLKADGFYISANNLSYKKPYLFNYNFKIIGSAHNIHELNIKKVQGCTEFVFSRIFKTNYDYKKGYLGILKFNNLTNLTKNDLIALGGIRFSNLNKMKFVKCKAFAISTEVKKKPAKIINRLF